jgi:hypothetical protein
MDILISIIIAGFASGYLVELISSALSNWVNPKLFKQTLTLPLAFAALWILGIHTVLLFVYTPASGFISLVILALVSKPKEITQVISRR